MHLALLQQKADPEVTCISAVSMFLGQGCAPQASSKIAFESCVFMSQQGSVYLKSCVGPTVQHGMHRLSRYVLCNGHRDLVTTHRLGVCTAHFFVAQHLL